MSSKTYASYRLSEAERARLERERQKKLEEERRQQEEERKREAELLRQRMIAEGNKRIEQSIELQQMNLRYRVTVLFEKMNKLQHRLTKVSGESAKINYYLSECNKLKKHIQTITHSGKYGELKSIEDKAKKIEGEIREHIKTQSSEKQSPVSDEEKKQEFENLLRRVENYSNSLPEDAQDFFNNEIKRLNELIMDAKHANELSWSIHFEKLKWVERDFIKMFSEIDVKRKERKENINRTLNLIDDLIIKLKIIQNMADSSMSLAGHSLLTDKLHKLYLQIETGTYNPNVVDQELPAIQVEVDNMFRKFEELKKKQEERESVLRIVEEVLTGMGYEVVPLVASNIKKDSFPIQTHFRTPYGEALELNLGLDESIDFRFKHAISEENDTTVEISRDEFIEACENWCDDQETVLRKLRERGVIVHEKSIVPPEETIEFEVVCFPSEIIEEKERNSYPEQMQQREELPE